MIKAIGSFSREIWGWAFYDFAHSAYSTSVISVIFNVYFVSVVVGNEGVRLLGFRFPGDALFGFASSLSMLFVFVTAPVMGAIADFSASKKKFLFVFCYLGVLLTALLYFVKPGEVWLGFVIFAFSNLAMESALTFYNAFLPAITTRDCLGRVSGFGWALGYIGSTLCLLLNLAMIQRPHWFSLASHDHVPIRASMVVVALWWGVFSIPTFLWLKERRAAQPLLRGGYVRAGFHRLRLTLAKVRSYRELAKFLLAYLVYNDGIQTVLIMAAIFGSTVLHMPHTELFLALLANQLVAFLGALGFGFMADKIPAKKTIQITLVVWMLVLLFALVMDQPWQFWVLSIVVGLVLGGSQSASRALFAQFTPAENSAEFFGFFAVCGKFASLFGPTFYALVSTRAGTRYAIGSILIFFVAGSLLLSGVNEELGKAQGEHSVEES